ncbi:MAG: co-chaperone GroES [Patescibacteria group bacterium]|nr:co-chaperone GroES [Patescibacteria group bacterium]
MSSRINIKPLGDRVLVQPDGSGEGKTEGGIILPDTVDKEKADRGRVVAVGEGRRTDVGGLAPMFVKKGQKVIFSKYGPDEVEVDGKTYYLISESNILAIIE